MILKNYFYTDTYNKIKNIFFLFLIFYLPLVKYNSIVKSIIVGKELYLISVVFLWLIFESINFSRTKELRIKRIDFLFMFFLSYTTIHYHKFSLYSFYNNQFWAYLSYIILFYLFYSVYSNEKKENQSHLFNYSCILILLVCFIQSAIGLLQFYDVLKSENLFYKVTGVFVNPNHLANLLMIGLVVIVYYLKFVVKERYLKFILVSSAIPISLVFYLSQCRAAWISLFVAVIVLFFSSKEMFLKLKKNKKKSILIIVTVIVTGVLSLFLLTRYDKDSLSGRALIRKITISKIKEQPVFGYGVGSFSSVYNYSKAHYFEESKRNWEEIKVSDYVSEAYNDFLQIPFEIGFVGMIIIGLILFFSLNNINLNIKTSLALGVLFSIISLSIFTTVLYNPCMMVLAVWALSIVVVYAKEDVLITLNSELISKSVFIFMLFLGIAVSFLFLKKTKLLDEFSFFSKNGYGFIEVLSDSQYKYIKDETYVFFRIGLEKYQSGDIEKGLEIAENALERTPYPEGNQTLISLYMQQNDTIKAEKLLVKNMYIEPFKYEYRNDLLMFYCKQKKYNKQYIVAKEIIDLPVKIQSKEVEKYKIKADSVLKVLRKI